jgi:hypothetical protein
METTMMARRYVAAALAVVLAAPPAAGIAGTGDGWDLSRLQAVATVDERFQSYNVEMVEVTGGRFWAPYGGPADEVYRMRQPEDLGDRRLRALARQLGPAYMRISGTWANSTYLEAEGEHLTAPPPGYRQILTRAQWRGVVDFARAVDARIGVSYAVSEGPRDASGVWQTEQAQRLLDLTRQAGSDIAYSEFINEPNAASLGHLPKDYSVADYARDFRIFRQWAQHAAPGMTIVGPGGVGEGADMRRIPVASLEKLLLTERLMAANPGSVDAVSYHFYGAVSQRCRATVGPRVADEQAALTPEWLDLTLRDWTYYSGLRDKYEPGKPMWVTETSQAACGGSPWAASFLDTFRYVNQLGLLAQKGVKVVFHNTLGASDYSLIEQDTRKPRPNYWAAVLWRRTMGTTVLAPPTSPATVVRIYAHCLQGTPGGVALAAINFGDAAQAIPTGRRSRVWMMRASSLDSGTVEVDGRTPRLEANGTLSGLAGLPVSGSVSVPGKSIAFIAVGDAGNPACR